MQRSFLVCSAFAFLVLAAVASSLSAEPGSGPMAATVDDQQPSPVPALVTDTWAKLVGVWVTDNGAYRSANEAIDQYAIEWRWGLGQQTLVGRLYGLNAGREIGTFWEFREFWHPGDRQVIAAQFGVGGAYGAGPHTYRVDGTSEMLQTFFDPAGRASRTGHRSELKGDEHVTHSFDVGADDVWTPRRTYTWRRQR